MKVACWMLNATNTFSCLLPFLKKGTRVPFSIWSARYKQAVNALMMSGGRRGNDWALVGDALTTCHRSEAETVAVKVEVKGILFISVASLFPIPHYKSTRYDKTTKT